MVEGMIRVSWVVGQPVGGPTASSTMTSRTWGRIWAGMGDGLGRSDWWVTQLRLVSWLLGIGRSIHAPAKSEAVRYPTKTKM